MKTMFSTALMVLLSFTSIAAAHPRPSTSSAKPATSTSSAAGGAPTYTPLTPAEIKALQRELILAPGYKDKEQVLFPGGKGGSANNVTFQFVPTTGPGQDGSVIVGSLDSIPGLIGTNVAAAVGFIGPCGLNVPHLHPRANEFLTAVQGTLIGAFVLEEDGMFTGTMPQVSMTLTNYTGMLFPMGHTHWQFNPTCEQAVFVAGFDSSDEGRFQVAQTFFSSMPDDVLTASLGNPTFLGPSQIDKLRGVIPSAFSVMVESCAKACVLLLVVTGQPRAGCGLSGRSVDPNRVLPGTTGQPLVPWPSCLRRGYSRAQPGKFREARVESRLQKKAEPWLFNNYHSLPTHPIHTTARAGVLRWDNVELDLAQVVHGAYNSPQVQASTSARARYTEEEKKFIAYLRLVKEFRFYQPWTGNDKDLGGWYAGHNKWGGELWEKWEYRTRNGPNDDH
ncbi:RmlC-like cupin domain-containing protein [Podospora australis]|uniref:RmlC-like cupin domain-containing protein n=1 Tax=Podospora australis TaxID=1536484 RepID=A0AAN7AH26_9PEZI|nr:RmlC-like cupin domain-containing protein [Podospora australis]